MVQFSLPRNTAGRANVLHSYILVFFKSSCGLDTLLIVPVIFKWLLNLLSCPLLFHKVSYFLSNKK
jgi:hypothetical protein